jgi:mRNA interferase MazF
MVGKIYFTDFSSYKIRLVLVIKQLGDDYICLQLTSKSKSDRITIDNDNLLSGKIKLKSFVVIPKNFTIHRDLLFKKIATVNDKKVSEIFNHFCIEIGCE